MSPLGGASDVRGVGVYICPGIRRVLNFWAGGKGEKQMGMVCLNTVVGPSADLP